jgi:hypothetical protein
VLFGQHCYRIEITSDRFAKSVRMSFAVMFPSPAARRKSRPSMKRADFVGWRRSRALIICFVSCEIQLDLSSRVSAVESF